MINELTQARVELARLEENALKQLLEARTAMAAQRTKITELNRLRPPIHRLPTELLVSILDLDVQAVYPNCHQRKWKLAQVSCRWRDTILDNPIFWTTINLTALQCSAIKTHLKRSGNLFLDIVIKVEETPSIIFGYLDHQRLPIVMPHVHRWRSLEVFDGGGVIGDDEFWTIEKYIEEHIVEFPSLKRAVIPSTHSTAYPKFLSPTRVPLLEHLELDECGGWRDFAPPSTLKTLKLNFTEGARHDPSFPYLLPTQTLTTLSLSGSIDWTLQPNSIEFPVLETLILSRVIDRISGSMSIMQAIVAPNLAHFEYRPYYFEYSGGRYECDSPSLIFDGIRDKFTSVHHITFSNFTGRASYDPCALPLCEAFPNVRHAELAPQDLTGLLMDRPCSAESAETTRNLYPIDVWKDLQNLTLRGPSDEWVNRLEQLTGWLLQRQKSGLPRLRIKVTDLGCFDRTGVNVVDYFVRLHNRLQDYCYLEFNIPMEINLRTAADSSLVLVSTLSLIFQVTTKLIFWFFLAFFRVTPKQISSDVTSGWYWRPIKVSKPGYYEMTLHTITGGNLGTIDVHILQHP